MHRLLIRGVAFPMHHRLFGHHALSLPTVGPKHVSKHKGTSTSPSIPAPTPLATNL